MATPAEIATAKTVIDDAIEAKEAFEWSTCEDIMQELITNQVTPKECAEVLWAWIASNI